MAITFLHKALLTKAFRATTNLTMKLVPLFSDRLPSAEQDIIHRTITKQALCLAEFEYVSNPHIGLIDDPCVALKTIPSAPLFCLTVIARKRPSSLLTGTTPLAKLS